MEQVTINAYKLDELTEKARERAMEWINKGTFSDSFWSESVTEDAKTIGEILGLYIENIYWDQYFYVTIDAHYSYAKGWKKKLKEYAPNYEDLFIIGQDLQDLQKHVKWPYQWEYSAKISQTWRNSVYIESNFPGTDRDFADIIKSFCHWVSRNLQKELDYLESEEYMTEAAEANDWRFDEEGRVIR